MTYEATAVELYGAHGDSVGYTCADTAGIEKGAILSLLSPRTASGATTADGIAGKPCAGIANAEKVINDGSTSLGVYTNGIFNCYASGAILIGSPVGPAGFNYIKALVGQVSGSSVLGYALQSSSGNEVIAVKVRTM